MIKLTIEKKVQSQNLWKVDEETISTWLNDPINLLTNFVKLAWVNAHVVPKEEKKGIEEVGPSKRN